LTQVKLNQACEKYENAKLKIDDLNTRLFVDTKRLELNEDKFQGEEEVYKLKGKHLTYKQNKEIENLARATNEVNKRSTIQTLIRSKGIRMEEASLRNDIYERKLILSKVLDDLRFFQQKEIVHIRKQHDMEINEIVAQHEQLLDELQKKLERGVKSEINMYEVRKEEHNKKMDQGRFTSMKMLKDYYQNTAKQISEDIDDLSQHVSTKRGRINNLSLKIQEVEANIESLALPLWEAQQKEKELLSKVKFSEKDSTSLELVSSRLVGARKDLTLWELELEKIKNLKCRIAEEKSI